MLVATLLLSSPQLNDLKTFSATSNENLEEITKKLEEAKGKILEFETAPPADPTSSPELVEAKSKIASLEATVEMCESAIGDYEETQTKQSEEILLANSAKDTALRKLEETKAEVELLNKKVAEVDEKEG